MISKYPAFGSQLLVILTTLEFFYNTLLLLLSNHKRKVMKSPLFFPSVEKLGSLTTV